MFWLFNCVLIRFWLFKCVLNRFWLFNCVLIRFWLFKCVLIRFWLFKCVLIRFWLFNCVLIKFWLLNCVLNRFWLFNCVLIRFWLLNCVLIRFWLLNCVLIRFWLLNCVLIRFHDKVVIEEELNQERHGEDWERTKGHLKEAKFRIESTRGRRENWAGRKHSSRMSSIISETESEPLRRLSRINSVGNHNHASNGFKDKPVPKPELHM